MFEKKKYNIIFISCFKKTIWGIRKKCDSTYDGRANWKWKTSLLNEDDFRYTIIHEQFNKKQDESQTSEVRVYNLKSPNGTIIQIVETPGFGDTIGIKKYIEINKEIR